MRCKQRWPGSSRWCKREGISGRVKSTCYFKSRGFKTFDIYFALDKSITGLTKPNGGEILASGDTQKIQWETNGTKNPVASVKLYYTSGGKWSLITTLSGNPGAYDWQVPPVPGARSKCKVRVLLQDGKGKTVNSDVSDADFTIQ